MDDGLTPQDRDALPTSLRDELRAMWEQRDPVPPALADRVVFALEVDAFTDGDLELELMRLQEPELVASRGEEVRTVTFGSETLTVMIAISDVEGGHRIDGWVAPGGRRRLEVRTSAGTSAQECDDTGRFALAHVPPGHFQLVLPDEARTVVTPALTL